jgi:hypothetical protein
MLVIDLVGVLEDGSVPSAGVPQNPRKTIGFPLGSDVLLRIRVIGADGSPIPLPAPASLRLTAKKRFNDIDAAFFKEATLVSRLDGLGTFSVVPNDTKQLASGQFAYDVWLTDADGKRSALIPTSPLIIEPAVTLPP